jgi:phosphonate transport system substrate-binding protein
MAALEGQLDTSVSLEIYDHYEEVLGAILQNRLEIAWMPPLLHERAGAGGAHLVALSQRSGALQFRSALLVRRESKFKTLEDLAGARAAWSDRHSASGHLYPKQHLANLKLGSENVYGSPLEAMNAVVDGRADLCAAFVSDAAGRDHARAESEIRASFAPVAEGLRVLDVTGPIPPDGIVVAAGVDPKERVRIAKALEKLHQAPAGKAALSVLMGAERLVISQVV